MSKSSTRQLNLSRRRLLASGHVFPPLFAGLALTTAEHVSASPLDDVSPSSEGLPGAGLFIQILSWGFWLGLAACGGAIVYGAGTWRGMGTNSGRGVEGKTWVAAGCIGALIIGLAPTIVSTFFSTGSAG